jgi:hypothetical protein
MEEASPVGAKGLAFDAAPPGRAVVAHSRDNRLCLLKTAIKHGTTDCGNKKLPAGSAIESQQEYFTLPRQPVATKNRFPHRGVASGLLIDLGLYEKVGIHDIQQPAGAKKR